MGTDITFSCGDFHNFYSQVYETMKVLPPPPHLNISNDFQLFWRPTTVIFCNTEEDQIYTFCFSENLCWVHGKNWLISVIKAVDICCFGFLTISSSFCTSPPVFLAEISSARLHVVLGVLSLFCIRDGSITRTTN